MQLQQQASRILKANWRNGYTVPSRKLYPFQWNWDSGFIAIGYAALGEEQYFWQEIEHLLNGQWQSGFIPHILYYNEEKYRDQYFPNADVWASKVASAAPQKLKTSGIAQPPVLAFAVEHSLKYLPNSSQERLREILPGIQKLQSFYRTQRNDRGAVSIYHPWESGMDNSPMWDFPLKHIGPLQKWHHLRRDLDKVDDPAMRPTHKDYDAYLTLVDRLKKHKYDDSAIAKDYPFQVKDVLASAFFIAGEEALHTIENLLGVEETCQDDIAWEETFFDQNSPCDLPYHNYDVLQKQFLHLENPYALLFLLSRNVDEVFKEKIVAFLEIHEQKMSSYPYPNLHASVYPWDNAFVGNCYWKGPIWVNINWAIYQGLKKHGFDSWSRKIREQILQMVEEQGFYEYFHPSTGQGLGADQFSWTAALVLDLLRDGD